MFALSLALMLAAVPGAAPALDPERAIARSVVLSGRGEFDAALAALDSAPRTAMVAAERARVVLERSRLFEDDPAAVERAIEAAEALSRGPGAAAVAAAVAHLRVRVAYGRALAGAGSWAQVGALLDATRTAAIALKDARLVADITFYRGLAEQQQGKLDAALPLFRAALEQAEASGDGALAASAERHVGFCLEQQGDVDGAETAYSRSIARRREEGLLAYVPFALITHAELREFLRGDAESALRELREAARAAASTNNRRAEVAAHLALARLVGKLGGAEDAAQHLRSAESAARAHGAPELLEDVIAATSSATAAPAAIPATTGR